ncbi:MAG: ABC transporter permease [Clostridia bacterium]|nr:ABC transporter permease [Clostridia bacterium]
MNDRDRFPKKSPLSLQLDLRQFEKATEEEKIGQDRMRESTSFFRDGVRRLFKNPVAVVSLVVVTLLILVAFIVPLFYPYDYATTSANRQSYSVNYLAPMQYSAREEILRATDAVFVGWSYPNPDPKAGYGGFKVIDSEAYLDEIRPYLVTDVITFGSEDIELYAVWSVDRDGDGVGDFGADLFEPLRDMPAGGSGVRYTLRYDVTGATAGTAPVSDETYVLTDMLPMQAPEEGTAREGAVFIGWSTQSDLPLITDENYADYKDAIFYKNVILKNEVEKGRITLPASGEDIVFYAVWAADADGNGKPDLTGFARAPIYKPIKRDSHRLIYNLNLGEGERPVDETLYAPEDTVVPVMDVSITKPTVKIFPHLLGTDELGRDYAIRVIVGMRVSLLVGIIAAVIVVIIGVLYGAISGYFGGRVDLIMMRIVDVIYSLPDTLIIILLSVSLKDVIQHGSFAAVAARLGGVGLVSILIVFALLYWVGMARLVRGQVLSLREQEFVLAAKAMDVSPMRIITRHMLPNCISVIVISAALQIPSAIFTESFLSFLGLGVSMPMPSLGSLASDYRGQMTVAGRGYLFIIPSLIIFLIVLSLNLLGQGLRDEFDPKLKEVSK